MSPADSLNTRLTALGLYGLLAHLSEVHSQSWVETLVEWEESERASRGLARRIRAAHIGRFRPMADFDWAWPDKIDRDAVEEAFRLDFISQADNLVLLGPNGVGKTMLAQNLCYQAVLHGVPALFTTASALLADLSEQVARDVNQAAWNQFLYLNWPSKTDERGEPDRRAPGRAAEDR